MSALDTSRPRTSPWMGPTIVVVACFVAGALTSVGQQYLPESLRSLANSSTSWSVVAFGVALLARRWWVAVAYAVGAFVLQLAGYEVVSQLRLGFGMAPTTWAYWLVLGALAGPALGLAAWWARRDPGLGRALGIALVAGIAVGEGLYGLTVVGATTSPVWWWISIALGVAAAAAYGALSRSPRLAATAVVATTAVALAFWWAYTAVGSYVVEV